MASPPYLTPLGYTARRPAGYPPIDRRALMANAHQIAKRFRVHYGSYHEALAYGLTAAWMQVNSDRTIRSLAVQAGDPTAAAGEHPAQPRRQPMLGSYAYAGA